MSYHFGERKEQYLWHSKSHFLFYSELVEPPDGAGHIVMVPQQTKILLKTIGLK